MFGTVIYQCAVLTWQISQKRNVELDSLALFEKSYVTENENGIVKIYWALTGMKQEDPILIEFIRNHVLIKPKNVKSYHNRSENSMRGQYGQPLQGDDKSMSPIPNIYRYIPLLDHFWKQILKVLKEQVKSKLFGVRW